MQTTLLLWVTQVYTNWEMIARALLILARIAVKTGYGLLGISAP